jgi:hypothetical protein
MPGGVDSSGDRRRNPEWRWGAVSGSTMHGKLISSAVHTHDPAYQHGIDIIEDYSGKGYSADLDYVAGYHGRHADMDVEQYRAGPFRTPLRAKLASMALAHRAEAGRADEYRVGRYTETAQEARWNREGLL